MSDQSIIFQDGSATISDKLARVGDHSFPISDIKGVSSDTKVGMSTWKSFLCGSALILFLDLFVMDSLKPHLFAWIPFLEKYPSVPLYALFFVTIIILQLIGIGADKRRLTLHTTVGPVTVLETTDTSVVASIQNAIETALSKR